MEPYRGQKFNSGGKPGFKTAPQKPPMKAASLPTDYLNTGYLDKDGGYNVDYITDIAENIGKQLSDTTSAGNTATSKVRAYFDIVESTHHQLVSKGINVNQAITTLATLKARVNNSTAKGNSSKLFKDFIDKNVDTVIKSSKDGIITNLTGFKQHFEAVICYMH